MRHRWSWGALVGLILGCSSGADRAGASPSRLPSFIGDTPASAPPGSSADGSGSTSSQGTGSSGVESSGGGEVVSDLPLAAGSDPTPPAVAAMPAGGSAGGMPSLAPPEQPPPAHLQNVLAFTRTTGFRHDSIEAGVQALQRLGSANRFSVDRTESPADFNDEHLALYDVVVWLNTDSIVLDAPARAAFQRYIRAGGGWVGVHAASNSETNWAWYGQLLGGGAFFVNHPPLQEGRVIVESADHPSTSQLPPSFTVQEEWYKFRTNPRPSVRVLLTVDESSYGVGDLAMGDHPIAWYHEFEGGRAWYTVLGHNISLYSDARFTQHLLGGIQWAAGAVPGE